MHVYTHDIGLGNILPSVVVKIISSWYVLICSSLSCIFCKLRVKSRDFNEIHSMGDVNLLLHHFKRHAMHKAGFLIFGYFKLSLLVNVEQDLQWGYILVPKSASKLGNISAPCKMSGSLLIFRLIVLVSNDYTSLPILPLKLVVCGFIFLSLSVFLIADNFEGSYFEYQLRIFGNLETQLLLK